jgi:hypothetical protein
MKRKIVAAIKTGVPIYPVPEFCRDTQISRTSIWRWARAGWLSPINIAGCLYLTGDDLEKFVQRARAGEFAKKRQPGVRINSARGMPEAAVTAKEVAR